MTRERVDSRAEAEDLKDEYHKVRPHKVKTNDHIGAAPVHGVTGTGMDGMEAQLDALVATEARLASIYEQLDVQRQRAAALTDDLKDGSGPIAAKMRQSFLQLADNEGGVQTALTGYAKELLGVRSAILNTLYSYRWVDEEAVNVLNRQVEEFNAEVR
jgi:hypothetical protein